MTPRPTGASIGPWWMPGRCPDGRLFNPCPAARPGRRCRASSSPRPVSARALCNVSQQRVLTRDTPFSVPYFGDEPDCNGLQTGLARIPCTWPSNVRPAFGAFWPVHCDASAVFVHLSTERTGQRVSADAATGTQTRSPISWCFSTADFLRRRTPGAGTDPTAPLPAGAELLYQTGSWTRPGRAGLSVAQRLTARV